MTTPVQRIVIVGGGTAGWLSACYIASKLGGRTDSAVSITVVDAPDIPTIGVGEGTWPTMRQTLADIGLDEADVLASCEAALKQGTRFDGWVTGSDQDIYYHPFTPPPDGSAADIVAAWHEIDGDTPFGLLLSS